MKELLSLHVGQAGVQIGNACWELYCMEHSISSDGYKVTKDDHLDYTTRVFNENYHGKFTPRALMLDLEPTVVDEIRCGAYKGLFKPSLLLTGKEDAANNYARGHYTVGYEIMGSALEAVRKLSEECESLQGFITFHSYGGGTGSGLTTLLFENLSEAYPKKVKMEFGVYPSPRVSTAVVEPYNAVLATHQTLAHCDFSFLLDNEAVYEVCSRKLAINNPTYTNLNRIMTQIGASVTSSMRLGGPVNVDLSEFQTNLVPFPRIHYAVASYAPILSDTMAGYGSFSVKAITEASFARENRTICCDLEKGLYMACCLLYRGDVTSQEVKSTIASLRTRQDIHFVDWCPTGFKVGINGVSPTMVPGGDLFNSPRSLSMVANTTSLREVFVGVDGKFDLMFSKKAFVHWFVGEVMEEIEFVMAREDLALLESDYSELNVDEGSAEEEV